MKTRREFMTGLLKGSIAIVVPLAAVKAVARRQADPQGAVPAKKRKKRWVFLMDANKCVGCGLCVQACKIENEIPLDANVSRTWVERYVTTKDGKVHADSPKAARDGFTSAEIETGKGKTELIRQEDIKKAFFVPKLCNQCENPPCVQVCPVGATYQTEDGVVLIDRKTCFGCGYCIMACPYGVRFFNPVLKVAEKCTFCYHRITKGLNPACVDACPFGARAIGDANNPDDPVTKVIETQRVSVLKDEYGCKPQAYYIGLSREVR